MVLLSEVHMAMRNCEQIFHAYGRGRVRGPVRMSVVDRRTPAADLLRQPGPGPEFVIIQAGFEVHAMGIPPNVRRRMNSQRSLLDKLFDPFRVIGSRAYNSTPRGKCFH
jgi:hypothetical protein